MLPEHIAASAGTTFAFLVVLAVPTMIGAAENGVSARRVLFIACAPMLVAGLCLAGAAAHFDSGGAAGVAAVLVLVPALVFSGEVARRVYDRAHGGDRG